MALSKFSLVTSGVGTVGAVGVGVTGWQVLGNAGPSLENTPFVGNFKSKPDASKLGLDANSAQAKIDGTYGCFSNFFEGGTISISDSDSSNVTHSIDSLKNAQPPSGSKEANLVGCMIMQFSYDLNDIQQPRWVFKGEITAKIENMGWALWISGYGGKSDQESMQYSQSMSYKLAFLEKKSEGSWEVKSGLAWRDMSFISTSYFSLRISDPNGKVWMDKRVQKDNYEKFVGLTADPKVHVHSYSGVWGVGKEGSEIFRDIDIRGGSGDDPALLGRDGGFGSDIALTSIYENGIWKPVNESDDTSGGTSNNEISKDILNKWYAPFNDKKGKWVEIKDYCQVHATSCGNTQ